MSEIRLDDVGVRFEFDRLGRVVTPTLRHIRRVKAEAWGLRHLNLHVRPGEALAVVGRTGSGKTTMLRIIAGVMRPDEGVADIEGTIGSLLATGAGVGMLLTGRENTELLGVLAGLTLDETRARIDEVAEHSQLGEAFDRPVHTYSEGMRARLGFAVIQLTNPSILLLDEVFEALDHEFRAKVEDYGQGIRNRGGIVVAAGHDHTALERIAHRALLLEQGHIRSEGPFGEVISTYLSEGPGEIEGLGVSAEGS